MENMSIYDRVRSCPREALRTIQAGKLKGKSDINPMWRIKVLTEQFGPCGVGWRTEDERFWTSPGAEGEVVAWCSIKLRYADSVSGEWSEPVFGIGGSMLVDTQKGNLTTNDDAFKMAYTDAISVACKALGVAADVYWDADRTKYTDRKLSSGTEDNRPGLRIPPPGDEKISCEGCGKFIADYWDGEKLVKAAEIAQRSRNKTGKTLCFGCGKAVNNEKSD